jgi:arylsulfatase
VSRCFRTAVALTALLSGACGGGPKAVVYDLAARIPVAETWSAEDVLRFGTPAAEPRLTEGFYRETGGGLAEPFLWSKDETEVAFQWSEVRARVAVLDAAPYRGVKEQSVTVRLNGSEVERFRLNETRHRYRIGLPASAQRVGDNRLRFTFAATASPADADPKNLDKRRLAAAFYTMATGPADDLSLEDLLARDAPRPFAVLDDHGVPALTLMGPAVVRFALRLPPSAELRFTPRLEAAAGAAAGKAYLHVLVESEGTPEHEVWGRVVDAGKPLGEQVVRLPGRAGDIVRVGLAAGTAGSPRFAWGRFLAPRVLGRGGGDSLEPPPLSPRDDARASALRASLAGANVFFVILDAARAQELGAYGYPRKTTPEIDRIASEGVVFDRVYTPAVYTLGAMSSVWTSQYPDRHHSEVSFSARLPKDRLTLAQLLSAQGIKTAGFVANAVAGRLFGFDRGFSDFDEVFRTLGSRGDVFREAVPPWLARNKDGRFFAYVHFREPHFPYDPPPPFDTRFGEEGPITRAQRRDAAFFQDVNQGRRPFDEAQRQHLVRLYDGSLAFADQEVGALRRALEAEGLWDKTVFILAADHGEELFERGWIGHNVHVYEPSVHVPLVIRFPKGTGPAGVRVSALADLLDVAPTVADVFGVMGRGGSDREFQGRSLLPEVMGAPGKPSVLSRTVWDRPRYALRDDRFKFFYDTRTGEEHLYDLQADPGETHDLLAREPLRAAYYRQALHHWTLELAQRGPESSEKAEVSKEQCENLKALGYVQSECR